MKPNLSYEQQTQAFSTWGDKLLQHTDVLHDIQARRHFAPITVQLAPTELCDSDCPFCSVQERPVRERIPWADIEHGLRAFRALGAKSLELTGGGNPLLYRDGPRRIGDVIALARDLGYHIGIITNSEVLRRHIPVELAPAISWIRVSLIKLDEGKAPADYDLSGFHDRVAFSYIIYDGTTVASIERIAELVRLTPSVKFVRIAPNCLNDDSMTIKAKWGAVIAAISARLAGGEDDTRPGKFFIKEIGANFVAHQGGCWVGLLRPYWVHDGIYICTSHVLQHRTYHPTWRLCGHREVEARWAEMNARFAAGRAPYDIDIAGACRHCYYANNNRLLEAVVTRMPDGEFA